ncbi:MAG: hypothetical protein K8J08_09890 [Thermoanaerobaculia bacterium]|nr:hypothetical protein [Thermoanaerobaculia bacterium]
MPPESSHRVITLEEIDATSLVEILGSYGVELVTVASGAPIPGSYWGEPEAGLIENRLYLRPDTPIQSALHEACHYICMTPDRRVGLHTDAGGGYDEEDGVCYLQIVLAGLLPGVGRERMWADMDDWGYTFRLGSARAWFEGDADDAQAWLVEQGLLDASGQPRFRLRGEYEEIGARGGAS